MLNKLFLFIMIFSAGSISLAQNEEASKDNQLLSESFQNEEERNQLEDKSSVLIAKVSVTEECDVIVAGGSLSALSAALTSAREGSKTCLIEPTDWPGGQMTNQGVSAIDEAWHTTDGGPVYQAARDKRNVNPELYKWITGVGNTGSCWVSRFCFEPLAILEKFIFPAIKSENNLKVFYNTVVKSVKTVPSKSSVQPMMITEVTGLQRKSTFAPGSRLSVDLARWYEIDAEKNVLTFKGIGSKIPIVIEATEWGEVLVLSGADYVQGIENVENDPSSQIAECGQSIVFPFVIKSISRDKNNDVEKIQIVDGTTGDHSLLTGSLGETSEKFKFSLAGYEWDKVWTYRRIYGKSKGFNINELSMQNWGQGNDYDQRTLLLSTEELNLDQWQGGVNIETLKGAEEKAFSFLAYLQETSPYSNFAQLELYKESMNSGSGLSQLPYMRDTRRSIGLHGFVLTSDYLKSHFSTQTKNISFSDRIAIGLYTFDVHLLKNSCKYPKYFLDLDHRSAIMYSLPLRALTNKKIANLIPTGKTMAQSFVVNASTRVHPTEFNLGVAAGVAAAFMSENNLKTTGELVLKYRDVVERVKKYQPLDWSL